MNETAPIHALAAPERITLELTNHCNLSCPVCPRQHMDYPLGFMGSSLFRRLVDEMAELNTPTLVPFFRGEPLLHSDCIELLAYAKGKGFTIQLATNGLLLTKETSHALVAMGVDFVSFSVDAIHADTYRQRRRGGSFTQMLQGIDHLQQARSTAKAAHPRIQISAVDTGMTGRDKKKFVDFWRSRADQIRIYLHHTKDGRFGSLETPGGSPRQPCLKPFREMVVYWDGRIAICNHDWNRNNGPEVHDSTIRDIWESPWYQFLRRCQQDLDFSREDLCGPCGHWPQHCSSPITLGDIIA